MDKKTKPQKTGPARLWEFAMMKKPLVFGSLLLSAAAASSVSFVPYLAIYRVVRELLNSLPDIERADATLLIRRGGQHTALLRRADAIAPCGFRDPASTQSRFPEDRKTRAAAILEAMGLGPFADTHPLSLSGGQKQRVAIAGAASAGKEFLMYD
ncbi:MAG: ATP-binding cassette domain-containing protein, partial [Treponema sp.]|nr:ATP-binding cassette domain-containing protein [Treponema sp.]